MGKFNLNAIVGQSGGPTSSINATLAGVIRGSDGNVGKLYGMKNGISGLLENRIAELNYLFGNEGELRLLENTPSAALGSCRLRLPDDLDEQIYKQIFEILEEYRIGYFFYIGGNDSMDTVAKLSAYAKKNSIDVSVFGIPKTVDNDLILTDHTPGFGSCAKYIAATVCGLWQDVSSYKLPSVTIVEVMGRDTGWLGCACALPKKYFGYGCDLVYIPEMDFSLDCFFGDLERCLCRDNALLVAVSEGIYHGGDNAKKDSFGHRYLAGVGKRLENAVKEKFKCKTRSVELNLPQRCATYLLSKTDIEESVLIGKKAAESALSGASGKMAAFQRRQGEYGVDIAEVDAYRVANKIKYVPAEFINREQNFVTDSCIEYLSPLINGEINIEFDSGMPRHFKLR